MSPFSAIHKNKITFVVSSPKGISKDTNGTKKRVRRSRRVLGEFNEKKNVAQPYDLFIFSFEHQP